ncbi:MAG: hypothetical protein V9G98_11770 [Candidatus Competibacter sp.]|nr:hypothetical protein [Candidatus Competibacter sp.]
MSQNALAVQDTTIMPIVQQAAVSLGTLQAASAVALVQGAREMAGALADVIERQHLATVIQGRKHVNVEGWTTLAVMLGVVAREVQTVETEGIYTAVVELVRMSDGACISRASAECGDEPPWNKRPRYARRSMAQTRATGKACRLAFSWIMALAGYEPTPAEEMPDAQKPDDDLPITGNQHKMLEARIGELGLNREGVKTWTARRFGIEHFQELNRQQFGELLAQLPKMAEIKAKREAEQAEQEAKAEREAIQAEARPEPEPPAQREPEPERPPTEEQKRRMKARAAKMEGKATELRDCRYYGGSGKTRYREAEEAAILENEARHLRHIAETA